MMLMPNKKKVASLIVGSCKSPDDGRTDFAEYPKGTKQRANMDMNNMASGGVAEDDSYAHEGMAQDILAAVKAGDAKRLASALKSCFEYWESKPHDEGGEEPSEVG